MKLYIFGHLSDDGDCHNPFAYSDNKEFIQNHARTYISEMTGAHTENMVKAPDMLSVAWRSFDTSKRLGIATMDVETFEYDPAEYEPRCTNVNSSASYSAELPDPKTYPLWVGVMWKNSYSGRVVPLFMPRQSTVFKGLGNGFYLTRLPDTRS